METIFNSVPVGLYRSTLDGRLLHANLMMAKLLGYDSVADLLEADGDSVWISAHEQVFALMDHDGATTQTEVLLRRRDGSTVWLDVFVRRIDDCEPFVAGIASDITARKQLEQRADRLARAAEASGEVIFMTDREGVFTYVNPAFTRVYGYTPDELIGKQTPRVLKSGLLPADIYAALWSELLHGRSARGELSNRRKDGAVVLIDGSASPVLDETGAITGFLAIQRDITERRRTEAALHESEALFRRVFDQLPIGAALVSTDGRFHRANDAYCRMLGYSEEELRTMTFLELTHPDERAKSRSAVAALVAGETEHIDLEKRYLHKNGSVVWGAVSVRLIKDESGSVIWQMPVIVDVTERRRLEHQLQQAQKMEAIGQLAGGIAHDFNNILTAVLGYCDLLLAEVGSNEALASDLRQIQDGGNRAAALTRQLLAFSRKQVLRFETADLNDVLRRFRSLVRPLIGEDVELRLDLADSPLSLRADIAQLEQVAMNLVVNARDAMPRGGTIRIRTAQVTVADADDGRDGTKMPAGPYVQLVVEDTGEGMTEETRLRLFEPFFTTKAPGKGTGLGLAVVYGIVKQMGGFISVDSEPGRGATFAVYFPRAERTGMTPEQVAAESRRVGGSERILLVEDDRDVRAFAAMVLRRSGYEVTEATTGAEALDVLQRGAQPHLVVSDMVMPEMSGPQLAGYLAQKYPRLPVLFTSGYLDGRLDTVGKHIDLLEKPFNANTLLERVRKALDEDQRQSRSPAETGAASLAHPTLEVERPAGPD